MLSLSLSVGSWNLSFELGKSQEEPESAVERVTLSDGTEIGAVYAEEQAIAGYGFSCIVGEAGPELIDPEDFGPGACVARVPR